jgi:hypothetical protein
MTLSSAAGGQPDHGRLDAHDEHTPNDAPGAGAVHE